MGLAIGLAPIGPLYKYVVILGCLQLVTVPRDVLPGHLVRDDDLDQLVLTIRGLGQLRQQLCRHVGQDHLQLAGWDNLPLDPYCSSCAAGEGFWVLGN